MAIKPQSVKMAIVVFLLLIAFSVVSYSQVLIHSADFETNLDGWTQDGSDDFDLTRNSGGTGSGGTGPNGASSGAWYLYAEMSNPRVNGDISILTSPAIDLTSFTSPQFTFDYHMYSDGASTDVGTLELEINVNGSGWSTVIFTRSGSQNAQNTWLNEFIDLTTYQGNSVQFRFIVTRADSWRGDIAFDNILIEGWAPSGPEINVLGNGVSIIGNATNIPNIADDTDYGAHNVGRPIEKTFTIENKGSVDLIITSISVSGLVFSITGTPFVSPIIPGGTTTFTITGTPSSIATFQETITISNNDLDEGSYEFDVKIIGEENFFDSDGDGVLDNIDIDDDNDGILDIDEENACKNSSISISANYKFLNETFGAGNRTTINTTYGFASTSYCYEDGSGDPCRLPPLAGNDNSLNDGEYTVYYTAGNGDGTNQTPNAEVASWADQYWYTGNDHTVGDTNGRMAMFNAVENIDVFTPGIFYTANIKGALPNVPITYSFWVINLDTQAAPGIASRNRPDILVEFRDVNDNLLASIVTGDIPPSINGDPAASWHQFTADLTFAVDEFYVYFYNNENGGLGNDLALDDIVISQTLCDTDNDGVADVFDLDSDNDGIPDVVEAGLGDYSEGTATLTNISGWIDSNGNGMHDLIEGHITLDSDGDGTPNFLDLDSDNDSIFDVDESGAGNSSDINYQNGDGDISGNGVGQGPDSDPFRETDVDADNTLEYFTDGILDIYDYFNGASYNTAYGNQNQGLGATYFVMDTDGDGTPDYIDTTSDGVTYDISHTLYASLDGDNNGVIDDTNDAEGDGILDLFDTDDVAFGSPRDLDRKLDLYFDGRNDYGEDVNVISSGSATIMSFIKSDGVNTLGDNRVVAGQNDFYIRVNNGTNTVSVVVEGTVLTSTTSITDGIWTHIAASTIAGRTVLYINGVEEGSNTSGGITDASNFTIGRASSGGNYYKGYLDELRVFDKALSANEIQKIIYQEIQDNGGNLRGVIIPRDVTEYINTTTTPIVLPWSNLKRYFRMDAYKDDIIDDLTTPAIDIATGAKIYNMKIIDIQTAPLPFITQIGDTTLPNAVDIPADGVLGTDVITYDWSIVKIEHKNTTYNADQKHLGLIVNSQDASSNPIEFSIQNNSELNISWYLELDGFIDLDGESQLVQGDESILDEDSGGYIERDQQGTANSFNYNYWSSSVGPIVTAGSSTNGIGIESINNSQTLSLAGGTPGVLLDGTTSVTPKIINFQAPHTAADSGPSDPITISGYWLWKFNGPHDDYDAWIKINEITSLLPGEGYTMKGTSGSIPIATEQNYVFKGRPYNGNLALNINLGDDRLIGNPYPSAIDADEFILDNISDSGGRAASNIFNGALYFWDHFGKEDSHNLGEYVGGYATRNLIAGAPAISNDARINATGATGSKVPGQYIPVNQGFFVYATLDVALTGIATVTGGNVNFKNSQRIFEKEAPGNSVFMKGLKSKEKAVKVNANERPLIRLMFDSPSGYHRQIVVGIDENATNSFDLGYDAPISEINPEDMYWDINQSKFVIQGVNNFSLDQELPLGLIVNQTGLVSIKIDSLENIEPYVELFIKDQFTGIAKKINDQPFEINLPAGEYKDRFSLTFKSLNTLAVEEEILQRGISVFMNNSNKELQITNKIGTEILSIQLFNTIGQQDGIIKSSPFEQEQQFQIHKSTGVYFVKINTTDGSFSKKIVVE